MNNTEVFKSSKKINLEVEDNKVDIVIKGLSKNKVDKYLNEIKQAGISQIIDFKLPSIV